jgi:DNA-binding transcriptional LysR family regulator
MRRGIPMNIDHMETFLTVCDCKNFSEAAKQLFVPQPTVSNRIRFIEESLGHELFIRSKKGVELTEHGRTFLPYAKHIVQTYELAVKEMNRRPFRNDLNIGSTLPFTFPFILDKLEDLYSHNPDLSLQMLSVGTGDVVRCLTERTIDIAFALRSMKQKEVEEHQIGSEALHLVLSKNHPLVGNFDIQGLLATEMEFVVYYQTYYEMFQDHPLMNLNYKRRFLTNHAGLIKQMILRMNAISILPLSFVTNELKRGELTFIPLDYASHQLDIPYYLLFRKNERYFEEILLGNTETVHKKSEQLPLKRHSMPETAPMNESL